MVDSLNVTIPAGQVQSPWVNLSAHRPCLLYTPINWQADISLAFFVADRQPGPIALLRRADGTLLTVKPVPAGEYGAAVLVESAWFDGVTMLQCVSVSDAGVPTAQAEAVTIIIKAT